MRIVQFLKLLDMTSKPRYCIGLDPGINVGFAVFDRDIKALITVSSHPLFNVFQLLDDLKYSHIEVFIENPNTWIKFSSTEDSNARKQGAGAVKQTYKHLVEFLEDRNIKFTPIKLQGTMKKVDSTKFKLYTKWAKMTNQHSRDASLMVYNR